jgi:hypothetical protein
MSNCVLSLDVLDRREPFSRRDKEAHSTLHPSIDRAWSRARPNVLTMSPVG